MQATPGTRFAMCDDLNRGCWRVEMRDVHDGPLSQLKLDFLDLVS